jgi:glycosyltransferase 2 family protein
VAAVRASLRRPLWLALKAAVTGFFLWVVATRSDWSALVSAFSGLDGTTLVACVLLTCLATAANAVRWQRALGYAGVRARLWDVLRDTFVGTTYNLLLPTSIGGDAVRALRCARRLGQEDKVWASVLFERVMGLCSLSGLALVGLSWSERRELRPLFFAAAGMTLLLLGLLLFAARPLRVLAARLAFSRTRQFLGGLAQTLEGPFGLPRARLETLGWSLAYQIVSLSMLALVAAPWADDRALLGIYLGVPIALVGSIVPITIGGLGLRESLFVLVLADFWVDAEHALSLSLVWLGSSLLTALTGAVMMWFEPAATGPGP